MHNARGAHHVAQGARGFQRVPSRGAHGAPVARGLWGAIWTLVAPDRGAAGGERRTSLCVVPGPLPCQPLYEGHWCA